MTAARPIVVVGGGLAGLAASLVLAESGHAVSLLDRGDGRRAKGEAADTIRTTTLNPLAIKVMRRIGILDWMEGKKRPLVPVSGIRVSDEKQRGGGERDRLLGWEADGEDGPPLALVARNSDLVEAAGALAGRHKGIELHRKVDVDGFTLAGNHGAIELADAAGGKWPASLVVACDGAGSPLREKAGIRTIARDPGQTAIVADIELEAPHGGLAWQRFLSTGPVALMPLDKPKLSSLVWTLPTGGAGELAEADDAEFGRRLTDAARSPFGALRPASGRHHWQLGLRHALRPWAERLVLLGDAAHAIHPLAGQGFNLAVGDMVVLAEALDWAVAGGTDPGGSAVLSRYARRRLPETAGMTLATDGLNLLFGKAPAPVRTAAGTAMAMLDRTPLKKAFMEFADGGLAMRAAAGGMSESDWSRRFFGGAG